MELDAEDVDFFRDPNEHHASGIVSRISIFDTAYALMPYTETFLFFLFYSRA